MNQILDTGDNKNKKQVNIKAIIRFFAIFLGIFGICIIGVSIFTIYKNINGNTQNQKPQIQIEKNEDNNQLSIKVTDDTGIEKIEYSLNDEEKEVNINGKKEENLQLELKSGENKFKIKATDINGEQKEIEELYEIKTDINIDISIKNNKANISIKGEDEISYVTYRWNEEEEKREEVNNTEYSFNIDSPKAGGKYVLTVIAVDKNNNTVEKTKEVIIDKEPVISVSRTSKEFVIKANDDEKLIKAELYLNGEKLEEIKIDNTDWEYSVPFVDGVNKLIIRVYNINNVTKEKKVMVDTSKIAND